MTSHSSGSIELKATPSTEDFDRYVGRTLDGKYRLDRLLGRGGMGSVYLAVHLGTERVVAVKWITPRFMRNQRFVERFKREARAAGRLRHPNIVDVTDFGFARVDDETVAYLVMEYLDGCALVNVLEEEKRLAVSWVVDVMEQGCDADRVLRDADEVVRGNLQVRTSALVHRYGELDGSPDKVFALLRRFAVSEDRPLNAEKFYRTVSEEFAATRPAFRWRHLVPLARVAASEYGCPAPGHGSSPRTVEGVNCCLRSLAHSPSHP